MLNELGTTDKKTQTEKYLTFKDSDDYQLVLHSNGQKYKKGS